MYLNKNNITIIIFSVLTIVIHLVCLCISEYGIFRDELYYLACSNHLDIGYVDHPPFSIWFLSAWKFVFGESLMSIRILPALCSGLTTFCIGSITREFGGQKYSIILACIASMLAPIFLAFFSVFNMNAFDMVFWSIVFLLLLKYLNTKQQKYWLLIGIIIGLGALNKISILWLGLGVFAGIILTSHRTILKSKKVWFAGLLALLIFSPFIIWNINHNFAHLEFIRNASSEKYISQNPVTFLSGLILLMNPVALPIWIAGFWFLMSRNENRIIGYSVLTVLAILIINVHSKSEYFASAMTILIPAGAIQLELIFSKKYLRWFRETYLIILTASGILFMPMLIDILPVETFVKYQSALGVTTPSTEGKQLESLPQFFADRFGWEELARYISKLYINLPDSLKQNCLIYAQNYGQAGAIEYYCTKYALPPVVSRHNNYWLWGFETIKKRKFSTIICINEKEKDMKNNFESYFLGFIHYSKYAMPYENNLKIWVGIGFKGDLYRDWLKENKYL